MKIDEYINVFKKTYKAKTIDFKDIRKYFSIPNMYGENFDIYYVSEREIHSNNFKTIIIKGSNVDPFGKYDYGTKAIILFAEYDENEEVFNHFVLSSFCCKDKSARSKLIDLIACYKKN